MGSTAVDVQHEYRSRIRMLFSRFRAPDFRFTPCFLPTWMALAIFGIPAVLPAEYRTIDGTGNNLVHPEWGSTGIPLLRMHPAAYPGDGSGNEILAMPEYPNPRTISNTIADQAGQLTPNVNGMTDMVWQWGQFLDHDISLTDNHPSNGTAPIPVEANDILGPDPIPFHRSNFFPGTGLDRLNPREQINQITAFIDASQVYGSDTERAAALRQGRGGLMLVSDDQLLPLNSGGMANAGGTGAEMFLAGDIRANEQVGLTAMHTLFVREHNRLSGLLQERMPVAGDEEIFQLARKIVGAEIQAITYQEFLPALLGPFAPDHEDYAYSETVNPAIANEFSTVLFRFGHSLLSPKLLLMDSDGGPAGAMDLRSAFFNPDFLREDASRVGKIVVGLAMNRAQTPDNMMVDDARNFLFGPPGAGGMDLAALNIQRSRDHGLPDYNSIRESYGLPAVTSFEEITHDERTQKVLEELYGDVNQIGPWIGGLADDQLPGSTLGELATVALVDQFTRLRDGDRFFYVGDIDLRSDLVLELVDLETLRLSDIVLANTDMVEVPQDMFLVPEPNTLGLAVWFVVGLLFHAGRRSPSRLQP